MTNRKLYALAALALLLVAGCSNPADPADNDHAKICADRGYTIHSHEQFGGKWSTFTYWCVDRNGQITDLWFGDD